MFVAFVNPQGNFDKNDSYWATHPDFGGQLVYVKEVVTALASRGHRLDIVTRQVADPNWPEFSAPFDAYPGLESVRIVRIPFGGPHFLHKEDLWPYLGSEFVPNIIAFYRGEGKFPNASTGHYGDGGITSALLAAETGIPFTFTPHSLGAAKLEKLGASPDNLTELDSRFHFGRRLVAERIAMSRANVCTASTSDERFEQYGHRAYRGAIDVADDERLTVIPPGVNLAVFDRDSRSAAERTTRAKIDAELDRDIALVRRALPVIIASSRLDIKKNHIGLVQAFASSGPLRARANLLLVTRGVNNPLAGYGEADADAREVLDGIMSVVGQHGLRGEISMFSLDSQDELACAYRYLSEYRSVFALTTFHEPFGLAPLEAMAAGLPAVVTKNGGPAESLRDGPREFGVLVDPFDSEDIARGLLQILGDKSVWERYAEAGRQRVHDRYTWDNTALAFERTLSGIVAQPPHPLPPAGAPIHPYFLHPGPANDIRPGYLADLIWGGDLQ